MKPKKQTKYSKLFQGTLIVAAMLIVGFATFLLVTTTYPKIYNEINILTKTYLNPKVDWLRDSTIDWFRGGWK